MDLVWYYVLSGKLYSLTKIQPWFQSFLLLPDLGTVNIKINISFSDETKRLFKLSQLCLVYLHEKFYLMGSRLFFCPSNSIFKISSQVDNSGVVSRVHVGCFAHFEFYFDKVNAPLQKKFSAALLCLFSFQNWMCS